jgi:hypothetical protein
MTDWNRKQEAAKRRDVRNIKSEQIRFKAAKKNTKCWCKGKIGIKHEFKCMPWSSSHIKDAKILACIKCGKQIDYYLPWYRKSPKPSWYT